MSPCVCLSMDIFVFECTHSSVYMYIYPYTNKYIHTHTFIHIYIQRHTQKDTYTYVCACVCVYVYACMYICMYLCINVYIKWNIYIMAISNCFLFIYALTVKSIWPPPRFLFIILKVCFLMKQVKPHNFFNYDTKSKSSSVTLTLS